MIATSLAGVVRAHAKAKELGLRFIPGCRLDFADGSPSVLCYRPTGRAYGRLTKLLTVGQMRARKGACELVWSDLREYGEGQVLIVVPPKDLDDGFVSALTIAAQDFPGRVWLAAGAQLRRPGPEADRAFGCARPRAARADRGDERCALSRSGTAPAAGRADLHPREMHDPGGGIRLEANAERHLKSPDEMARLFAAWPEAVARTLDIAELCRFFPSVS